MKVLVNSTGIFLRFVNEIDEIDLVLNEGDSLIEDIPTDEELQYIRLKWDSVSWIEAATPQEIEEASRSIVPKCISRRQFFTQLFIEGINEQDIVDVINQLPPIDNSLALIAFREAATFERNSPLLVIVGQMLGLTESEIDTIFLNASSL